MVFLDMEKAFDRVSWDYLHKTLEALGFKPEFRKWVSLLYDHANPPQRRLALNGHLGSKYSLGSGVPQGCPLSPILFLCVQETLTRSINSNHKILGIELNNGDEELKLSQFADDTVLLLRNYDSWREAKKELARYERVSG